MKAKFRVDLLSIIGEYEGRNYNGHAFDGVFDGYDCIAMIINDQVVYILKSDLGIDSINELRNIKTSDIIELSMNIDQEIKDVMVKVSDAYRLSNDFNISCTYKSPTNYKIDGIR